MTLHPHDRRALAAGALLASLGALLAAAVFGAAPDPVPLLSRTPRPTLAFLDRHGERLRLAPDADGIRYRPVDPLRVSRHLVGAVLAAEDRRFFAHGGLDPLAVGRAAWQNLRQGRIVSGASTLSMQLARLLDPRPRGAVAKVAQVFLALRIEATLPKERILAEYLGRAPMGNRVVGFEAASEVYLGKRSSDLSPAEAALLACVPRSPSRANPWKRIDSLRSRRDEVLRRMARLGLLDPVSLDAALAEPIVLARDPLRREAPAYVARAQEEVGATRPGERQVAGTLDPILQRRVEALVRRHLAALERQSVRHMAVAVLDVERGEWIALVGSGREPGEPGGAIDGTRVPRQPGSALKPFTYAAAFDRGLTPASVLADVPRSFPWSTGTWTPRNYDDRYHGPLRAREALARSVNVPAALVLRSIGPARLLDTLRSAGITTLAGGADAYGLGLTLGAGEVRLDELTNAYAALVREGEWRPATAWRAVLDDEGAVARRPDPAPPRRISSREAAAQVVDILADPDARAPAFGLWSVLRLPFPAMVKTGTSEGFRDNWCVGGTREVMVGVWCGNFDRTPMGNVSGVQGAGTLWREVMLAWAEVRHRGVDLAARGTLAAAPDGMVRVPVCSLSGLAPTPACPVATSELLRKSDAIRPRCDWHAREAGRRRTLWPAIYREWATLEGLLDEGVAEAGSRASAPAIEVVAPAHGDSFLLSPDLPRRFQTLELRCAVRGAPREVAWLVNGREIGRSAPPYGTAWPIEPGVHRIEAESNGVRSAPVTVTVYGG